MLGGKLVSGYPFKIETNVNAKVVGPNKTLKQTIDKHNMATANMTEGIVRFLRGEFTEAFVAGHIPNIGNNFNIADQFIPAYIGLGCAGVSAANNEFRITYDSGIAPSYADTDLVSEILPMANPSRALVTKSVKSDGSVSHAYTLTLSTAYHFDTKAETQTFSIDAAETSYMAGREFYITDNLYPNKKILQRLRNVTPISAGWRIGKSHNSDSIYVLYYGESAIFDIDYTTGKLTLKETKSFPNGLELSYDPVNFDFVYKDNTKFSIVPYTETNLVRTYNITELGLFSGNVSNDKSKLLARVLLDEDTPIVITEGDYVIVTWQIGVYALEDSLFEEDIDGNILDTSDTYKYVVHEQDTDLAWSEITDITEDGQIIEDTTADTFAVYAINSIDFINHTIAFDTNYMQNLLEGDIISIGSGKDLFSIKLDTINYQEHSAEFSFIDSFDNLPLNSYTDARAVLNVPITKTLKSESGKLESDLSFTFTLQESDAIGTPLSDEPLSELSIQFMQDEVTTQESKTATFPTLKFTNVQDTKYYIISEIAGINDAVIYDTTKYLVETHVAKDMTTNQLICNYALFKLVHNKGTNVIERESATSIHFINIYRL